MKSSGILLMSGNDDIGQHVRPTDKPWPQELKGDTFFLFNNEMSSYTHKRKVGNQIYNRYDDTSA